MSERNEIRDRYRFKTWLIDNLLKALLLVGMLGLGFSAYYASQKGTGLFDVALPWIAWCMMLFFIVKNSIVKVPGINFGEYRVFGERNGRNVGEGLHWCWFWHRIHLHDASIKSIDLDESFTTQDEVEAKLKGSTQYRIDDHSVSKFAELSDNTVKKGLGDLISSEIGIIAGHNNYNVFITDRETVQLIINCVLCLEKVPHHDLTEIRGESAKKAAFTKKIKAYNKGCDEDDKLVIDGDSVEPKSRIAFYKLFSKDIKEVLKEEVANKSKNSRIEAKYAIDIEHFGLADVTWTDGFKKSLEQKNKAEKESEAVIKITKDLGEEFGNIPQTTALHASMAMTGNTSHQTVAVEGESGGVMPIIRPDVRREAAASDSD